MKPTFGSGLILVVLGAAALSNPSDAAQSRADSSPVVKLAQARAPGGPTSASEAGDATASATDRYGSLATGMPYDHEIRVGPNTRRIAVWRLQTVRFSTADGRAFTWRFDGLRAMDEFPLAAIAPAGFDVPRGAVVSLNGEIPISP
jgi:hypothetical protein